MAPCSSPFGGPNGLLVMSIGASHSLAHSVLRRSISIRPAPILKTGTLGRSALTALPAEAGELKLNGRFRLGSGQIR